MLVLDTIFVTFNRGTRLERQVLSGLNLSLHKGEFVTIIGSNGAGKSTILNVISGDILPEQGKVSFDTVDCAQKPNDERARLVAKVVQNPLQGQINALTVEENLAFAFLRGQTRGLSLALNQARREFFMEKLAPLGMKLEERLKDHVHSLSGGQRQALSLIMATLAPTEVLLLDEHTAALDPKMANTIMEITQQVIRTHGITALMVTHNMSHALHYGDRTVLLHEGRVLKSLSLEEKQQMKAANLAAFFDEI